MRDYGEIGKNRDDITVYSDEDSLLDSLDSIEVGRSMPNLTEIKTPYSSNDNFSKFGSINISPYQRIQTHYFNDAKERRARNMHFDPSKIYNDDLSDIENLTDNELVKMDNINISQDFLDKDIDRILKSCNIKTHKPSADTDLEKTELIIKETHKLINTFSGFVGTGKDTEKYHQLLSDCINKLVRQYQKCKEKLKARNHETNMHINQIKELHHQIAELKKDNINLRKEDSQKIHLVNESDRKEQELLREKLSKYRNLYLESQKELDALKSKVNVEETHNGTEEPEEQDTKIPAGTHENRQEELLLKFEEILRKYNSKPPATRNRDAQSAGESTENPDSKDTAGVSDKNDNKLRKSNYTNDLLKKFEDSISSVILEDNSLEKKHIHLSPGPNTSDRRSPEDPLYQQIYQALNHQSDLYEKLMKTLEKPKEHVSNEKPISTAESSSTPLHTSSVASDSYSAAESEPMLPNSSKDKSVSADKDIVLQCYLCCPNTCTRNSKKTNKAQCPQCSQVHLNKKPITSDNTINLMGEYKWNL